MNILLFTNEKLTKSSFALHNSSYILNKVFRLKAYTVLHTTQGGYNIEQATKSTCSIFH
jgi:hypothetical protein